MSSTRSNWKIGDTRNSEVHFKKIIQDLRNQFPYDSLTAFIVETFANSIDAGANRIDIFVGKDIIKILDNGEGMEKKHFIDYHNLASLTKTRGISIGFAGVGAKIYLDKSYYIITETKSKKFHSASKWGFHGDKLRWTIIPTQNRVTHENPKDIEKLSPDFLEKSIKAHYNAILLGHYGKKTITINRHQVQPFEINSENIELRKEFQIKVSRNVVKGFIIKSKKDVEEPFQGPQIVVYGKTITTEWFRQYPTYSKLFTGMFFADHLIKILTTSKTDFDRTTYRWRIFNNRVGQAFGMWLDEINAKAKLPEPSEDLNSLSDKIEKNINELLRQPQFSEIANKLFQNLMHKRVSIRGDSGTLKGVELEGGQLVKGTLGNLDSGKGITTFGNNDIVGIVEDEQGDLPIKRIRRRARAGIKISFIDNPEEIMEAWIDPSTQTITINQGHPSWKVAEKLNRNTKSENVTFYHMLRSIFNILAKEAGIESPENTVRELFQGLMEIMR